ATGKNITIYGGFAGTENSISARDIVANPTILSGIMGNDTAYHVLVLYAVVISTFDGITITGGAANGPNTYYIYGGQVRRDYGGGLASYGIHPSSTVNISNSTIRDNYARIAAA